MNEKMFNTRIIHKHDSEANWNKAVNFIPIQGEIIVYDIDETYNYERVKIGDGIRKVNDLPFVDVQPDWNQNDSTAPDYVKNRPFYTGDPVETVLVEESTVSFVTAEGLYAAEFPSTFEATVGVTYTVTWDGTAYECTCVDFDGSLIIGNLSIINRGSDTGEPFVMGVYNGDGITIITEDTSASHTFSISGLVQEVVKLDKKYLPQNLATKSEVEAAQTTADNAQTIANNAQTAADAAQTAAENVNQKTRAFSSVSGSKTITVTRSNGTSGDKADAYLSGGTESYHLSYEGDFLPTKDTLIGSSYKYKYTSGQTAEFSVTENKIFVSDQGDKAIFVTSVGIIATEAGTYTFSKYRKGARATLNNRGIYLFYDTSSGAYVYSFVFAVITKVAKADFGSDGLSLYSSSGKKFKITVDDSGKPTFTNSSDSTDFYTPTDLPSVTTSDSGKFLRVSSAGEWVAETISNAEEASF